MATTALRTSVVVAVVCLTVFAVSPVAAADSIKFEGVQGTTVNFSSNTPFTGRALAGEFKTDPFGQAFCVDLYHAVNPYGSYSYKVLPLAGNDVKAAWLMAKFGDSLDDNYERAGLQAAIWKAIYGDNFQLADDNPEPVKISYGTFTAAITTFPVEAPAGFVRLDVGGKDVQDMVARVPEPLMLLLLGVGLLGLVVVDVSRPKKKRHRGKQPTGGES